MDQQGASTIPSHFAEFDRAKVDFSSRWLAAPLLQHSVFSSTRALCDVTKCWFSHPPPASPIHFSVSVGPAGGVAARSSKPQGSIRLQDGSSTATDSEKKACWAAIISVSLPSASNEIQFKVHFYVISIIIISISIILHE